MFSRSISLLRTVKRVITPAKSFVKYQKHAALAFIAINMRSYCSAQEEKEADYHHHINPETKVEETNNENVKQQIEQLIKENKCVLFMKGVPQKPQCGFSRSIVELLKLYNIEDYKAVDVLKDPVLREAVKEYSDWPTYPQLYINGKLVGGADIIKDMHKEGFLKEFFMESGLIKSDY